MTGCTKRLSVYMSASPSTYSIHKTQQGLQLQIANQTKTPKHKHSCDLQNNDVTA